MKRTTTIIQNETSTYDENEEPIVLSKPLLDILLKEENPADLIALYCFYYYTAKWQKTNQPKATDKYCMSGLKWGHERFYKTKEKLSKLNLIEKVCDKTIDKKIIGWYVKVNFIWKHDTFIQNAQNVTLGTKNQNAQNPHVGNERTNALSTNIENALSTNRNVLLRAREKTNTSPKERSIIPPKLEWVKQYCSKKNSPIDAEEFHNFYSSKGWMIGKNKMVDWHKAIATWEGKLKKEKQQPRINNHSGTRTFGVKSESKFREYDIEIVNN